jgi:hypothetical protein
VSRWLSLSSENVGTRSPGPVRAKGYLGRPGGVQGRKRGNRNRDRATIKHMLVSFRSQLSRRRVQNLIVAVKSQSGQTHVCLFALHIYSSSSSPSRSEPTHHIFAKTTGVQSPIIPTCHITPQPCQLDCALLLARPPYISQHIYTPTTPPFLSPTRCCLHLSAYYSHDSITNTHTLASI